MGEIATRRTAVIAAAFVLVLSMALPVAAAVGGIASASAAVAAPAASHAITPAGIATPSVVPQASVHPEGCSGTCGTLNIYEVAAAGATTEDPALAYDTVSYEPILNVYQTLINYNGTSTDTYVPTLATCIPGSAQCVSDYGTNLTTGFNSAGTPEYWTFVIDPQAQFFDPSSGAHWSVYPSDVMFSLARTMAFTDIPYVAKTAGWIMSQSLLQYGNGSWDGGTHFLFNNTPNNILSSMLINDSTYCPAKAMDGVHGNGCVTFVADGSGQYWPFFLDLIADNLGASVVPCGWFTAQGAGLPGWSGSAASGGDGPCLLPDGGTTTSNSQWSSYIAGLDPTSWDSLEQSNSLWPATQPGVQWNMVGSGPYAAAITVGTGYQLEANPYYAQPSGCSGINGMSTIATPNYCDPAAGGYQPHVFVFWEPNDAFGISQYNGGLADLAGIEAVHTSTLLSLAAAGKLYYFSFPTISDFFIPVNLAFNEGTYSTDFPSQPAQSLPETAFSNLGLRNFYVDSYPYLTVENTIRTVDGIQYSFNSGGAIPYGMGNYYPNNVSYPGGDVYHPSHDPDTNPADVGGAAWWWAQITSPTSPYYDAALASCTHATPCSWAIAGIDGDPGDDVGIADWISQIVSMTHGALQPFGGASFDLTFTQFLTAAFGSPYDSPLVSEVGTGWAPDYPDPTDYVTPMLQPDATYTASTTFFEQTNQPANDNVGTCGHNTVTVANLDYWANASDNPASGVFNSACQGVAYDVAVGFMSIAGALAPGPNRVLYYNLIEQITNRLAMYVWNGQTNEVVSAAPWIAKDSINQNVMIGGGGDQPWFHVQYQSYTPVKLFNMTFTEKGLPASTSWSVNIGALPLTATKTTTELYQTGNGTVYYSFNASAAGYGAYKVAGPKGTTYTSVPISGAPVALTVYFAPLETVYFNETGLANGSTWSVFLTGINGVPGASATGTVNLTAPVGPAQFTSFSFTFPAGTHYKYQVVKPSTYKAGGLKGSFGVPSHTFAKLIKFVPFTSKVSFSEKGLPGKTSWSVNLIDAAASFDQTLSSTTSTIKFSLENGTYTVTVPKVGTESATVVSSIVVVAPHGQTIKVTFAAYHLGDSVTRDAAAVSGHTNLIATPAGRDVA